MNSTRRRNRQGESDSTGPLAPTSTNACGIIWDKSVDLECPHCPVNETGSYIEFHYRRGRGSWNQIEEYAGKIARFVYATRECDDETRQALARLVNIPEHRSNLRQYECDGEGPKRGDDAPTSPGSWRFHTAA
jgi:hypothetical protein